MNPKNKIFKIIYSLLLIFALPMTLWSLPSIQDWRKSAFGKPANIVINAQETGAPISSILWQNFAQGGESPTDMLSPIADSIRPLLPKMIRIDHVFDHHIKTDGESYDFSQLDKIVNTIIKVGAKPMLSLSYMPSSLAKDGNVTSEPKDWSAWQQLVAATVSRYSGKNGFNIDGIYYEVWNEPDLFGNWHYAKKKNYLTLYLQTVSAIKSTANTNSYKIGGPATTGFYPGWIKSLLNFCHQNQLPLDFISWHRYSKHVSDYLDDFEKLNQILTDYPEFYTVERLITEFGPNPEISAVNDNKIGAIHDLAVIVNLVDKIHRIFSFELVDGLNPEGKELWGRWGLLTHPSKGLKPKPRYHIFAFLTQMVGNRLSVDGEGTWVSAIASFNNGVIRALVVNYDPSNKHSEAVPITLKGIAPGKYQIKTTEFLGQERIITENFAESEVTRRILFKPNSAVIIEWQKI